VFERGFFGVAEEQTLQTSRATARAVAVLPDRLAVGMVEYA
jgi:hypothetical protein